MSKKDTPKVTREDRELFRESITDVKPLKVAKRHTHKIPPKIKTETASPNPDETKRTSFVHSDYTPRVEANEHLEFAVAGVQPKLRKKLRQGRYDVDYKIDLHGLTVAQSGLKIDQCIETCLENAKRCILLIHGRGSRSADHYPVLKSHVNNWLRHCPNVIAFVSAAQKDGGVGAMYVLLKQTH